MKSVSVLLNDKSIFVLFGILSVEIFHKFASTAVTLKHSIFSFLFPIADILALLTFNYHGFQFHIYLRTLVNCSSHTRVA